jgi:hypothetical protein
MPLRRSFCFAPSSRFTPASSPLDSPFLTLYFPLLPLGPPDVLAPCRLADQPVFELIRSNLLIKVSVLFRGIPEQTLPGKPSTAHCACMGLFRSST